MDGTEGEGGALLPRHASTPAHPSNQTDAEFPPSSPPAPPTLDTVPEANEDEEPESVAPSPQGARAPPSVDPGPSTAPLPAEHPNVDSDAEIARQINAGERESSGMTPFPEARRTQSGRDTRPPDRLQADGHRTRTTPRWKK